MKTYCFSYTRPGAERCAQLAAHYKQLATADFYGYALQKYAVEFNLACIEDLPSNFLQTIFSQQTALVFIGAVGIAVRKIAPLVSSKHHDAAVVVIDEQAQFVISLLSGHIGGANDLAVELATILNATPVITTATDLRRKFAVDSWAVKAGLVIRNPAAIKAVSAAVLDDIPVGLVSDFTLFGSAPVGIYPDITADQGICISLHDRQPFPTTLLLSPRCVVAGIGCRKQTPYSLVSELLLAVLAEVRLPPQVLTAIATIDLKRDEPALLQLAADYKLPLLTYSAAELNNVAGEFNGSAFVKTITGVDNVCERAAVKAGGTSWLCHKRSQAGVTLALMEKPYTVRW